MEINISNIEEKIFFDQKLRKVLNDFNKDFSQWQVSKLDPKLKSMGQRAILNVLNNIQDSHLKILTSYFNEVVSINKLDYKTIQNFESGVLNLEDNLNQSIFNSNYTIYREDDKVYMTFWR